MQRLTFINKSGRWGVKGIDLTKLDSVMYGCLCKLKDYENLGVSPSEMERALYIISNNSKSVSHKSSISIGDLIDDDYVINGLSINCGIAVNFYYDNPFVVFTYAGYRIYDKKYFAKMIDANKYFAKIALNID